MSRRRRPSPPQQGEIIVATVGTVAPPEFTGESRRRSTDDADDATVGVQPGTESPTMVPQSSSASSSVIPNGESRAADDVDGVDGHSPGLRGRYEITIGAGYRSAKTDESTPAREGRRLLLAELSCDAVAAALRSLPPGEQTWWSTHTWRGDYSEGANWEASIGTCLDLDWYEQGASKHSVPPPDVRVQLATALDGMDLAIWRHDSPRGARVHHVHESPIVDTAIYVAAATAFVARVELAIGQAALLGEVRNLGGRKTAVRTGYVVDRSALTLASQLWTPTCALVHEPQPRNATIVVVSGDRLPLTEPTKGAKNTTSGSRRAMPREPPDEREVREGDEATARNRLLAALGALPGARTTQVKISELRCPLHGDRSPSAVVFRKSLIFYCSAGCTQDTARGWPLRRWIAAPGWRAILGQELVDAVLAETAPHDAAKPPSAATRMVDLALASGIDLFVDESAQAHARVAVGDHRETHRLRDRALGLWLERLYHRAESKAPGRDALASAVSVLEGRARFDGEVRKVHVRVAGHEGRVYVDLADERWRVVEIDNQGWRVIADAPVHFRRPDGLLPLPEPTPGGAIDELRNHVRLSSDDDYRLVVSWLVAALLPEGPYAVVALRGEQGTAKSTMAKRLRSLIDPNKAPLRSMPREERDLAIACTRSWLPTFDNVSTIKQEMSDALCRVSTGGGLAVRSLYTDDGEAIFDFRRPVLLTGIADLCTRADLADRTIVVTLPKCPKSERRLDRVLEREWAAAHPRILGALFSLVSAAIARRDLVVLPELPRMADFAIVAVAVEHAAKWPEGSVLAAYARVSAATSATAVESDAVATALLRFVRTRAKDGWSGQASNLMAQLNSVTDDKITRDKTWPRQANYLTNRLRRAAPALREMGWEVDLDGHDGKQRAVIIRPVAGVVAANGQGTGAAPSAESSAPTPAALPRGRVKLSSGRLVEIRTALLAENATLSEEQATALARECLAKEAGGGETRT